MVNAMFVGEMKFGINVDSTKGVTKSYLSYTKTNREVYLLSSL